MGALLLTAAVLGGCAGNVVAPGDDDALEALPAQSVAHAERPEAADDPPVCDDVPCVGTLNCDAECGEVADSCREDGAQLPFGPSDVQAPAGGLSLRLALPDGAGCVALRGPVGTSAGIVGAHEALADGCGSMTLERGEPGQVLAVRVVADAPSVVRIVVLADDCPAWECDGGGCNGLGSTW